MNHKVQKFNPDDQTEVLLIYDSEERTFWANQKQMGEMYGVAVNTINEHVKSILSELNDDSVIRSYRIRAIDGKNYNVKHYNHRIILRVGFRCRSPKADIYQEWATGVLFRELMQEKRDEERDAYRPLKRALCMAVDYSSKGDESRFAFAAMQDMMHYAAVGATAAGILMGRADAKKQNMGLTTFTGKSGPQKKDVTVAKNYLSDKELDFMSKISHGIHAGYRNSHDWS